MPPTLRGGNFGVIWGKSVKLMVFFFKSSSLIQGMVQTNYIHVHSNDDQVSVYQNCQFHDPWGRGSCDGTWPYKSYSENALFSLKIFFSTLRQRSGKLSI